MSRPSVADLDLPIFDPSERLYIGSRECVEAGRSNAETFLRAVYNCGPGEQNLVQRLELAKTEQENLARLCGATIVPHRLGLYPIEDPSHYDLSQRNVPEGFVLAAEVDTIASPTKWYSPRPLAIYWGIHKYRAAKGQLRDPYSTQFIQGRRVSDPDADATWYLVDIEPRLFSPHHYRYEPL